jgi:hypothetical protein
MNFFKKILGSTTQIAKNENIMGIEVIGFIYATVVFSHGWNDPSELMPEQTAIILDIVQSEDELEQKLNYWNKIYYNQITQHYSINEDQLESISGIINVPKEKYRELYAHWPDSISEEIYLQIYNQLELKFVQYKPLKEENKGKYAIRINEKFWDIKIHNSTVLVDIVNTYERNFKDFELFHDFYEEAMNYGVIIMDRLCNQRGPDNSYYYEQAIKQQNTSFQKLPIFDFNSLKYKEVDVRNEYQRIINEMNTEIKLMTSVIEGLGIKPFEIVKIKDDD